MFTPERNLKHCGTLRLHFRHKPRLLPSDVWRSREERRRTTVLACFSPGAHSGSSIVHCLYVALLAASASSVFLVHLHTQHDCAESHFVISTFSFRSDVEDTPCGESLFWANAAQRNNASCYAVTGFVIALVTSAALLACRNAFKYLLQEVVIIQLLGFKVKKIVCQVT